jgi:hypothetical protein
MPTQHPRLPASTAQDLPDLHRLCLTSLLWTGLLVYRYRQSLIPTQNLDGHHQTVQPGYPSSRNPMKYLDTYCHQHNPKKGEVPNLSHHFLIPNSNYPYRVQFAMRSELAYLCPLSARRPKSMLLQPRYVFSVPLCELLLARLALFHELIPSSLGPSQQ